MDRRTDSVAPGRDREPKPAGTGMWQHLLAVDWTTVVPVVGVGVAAAVASFDSLRKFAVAVGWPAATAWLLPFCLDLYAVMALRLWLRTDADERTRNWAARSGWLAVALSVGGNAVQHAVSLGYWTTMHAGMRSPHLVIVVVVAAVPPVMLALLIHLESMRRTSPEPSALPPVLPEAPPAETPTPSEPPASPEPPAEDEQATPAGDVDTAAMPDPDPPEGQQATDPGRSRRGSSGQRARVAALLSARPGAITASAYELGGELANEVGGHPQTVRRYVREWQESQRTLSSDRRRRRNLRAAPQDTDR